MSISASDLYSDEVLQDSADLGASRADMSRYAAAVALTGQMPGRSPALTAALVTATAAAGRESARELRGGALERDPVHKAPPRAIAAVPSFPAQDMPKKRMRPDDAGALDLKAQTASPQPSTSDVPSSSKSTRLNGLPDLCAPKRVAAYAKLHGDHFEYLIRSFSVVLGRTSDSDHGVDCELGKSKSISRRHATITFDTKKQSFQIQCFGKHPILVNGHQLTAGATPVDLKSKTHVQIGDQCFYFLLPKQKGTDNDSSSESGRRSPSSSSVEDLPLDGKPTLPIKALIAQAILNSPEKKLTVHDMYSWIMEQWPYYKSLPSNSRWQNCIRHNLSMNPCFVKVPRADEATGKKGAFWTLKGSYEDVLLPPRKVARNL